MFKFDKINLSTIKCRNFIERIIMQDKWEFYVDSASEHRWRRTASNGRIVGASSQGYVNKQDCIDNARRNGYVG